MRLMLLLIGISFSIAVSGQKEKTTSLKWRNNPSEELKIAENEYMTDKKGLVKYYLSNDSGNLYIDMMIRETLEQNKILKIGMTVWICLDGKSQKKTGIRYPIGSVYSSKGKNFVTQINPPTPLAQANTIQLMGFGDVQPSRFPSDNRDNIRGKVKYNNNGDLIYSLVIPLSKLSALKAESIDKSAITVGIEYGAPPEMIGQGGAPSMASGGSRGSGGGGRPPSGGSRSGGGGRGAPGGGAPGGGTRPAPSSSTEMGSPVLLWIKDISLAKSN